jgi:hypothetical protein
MRKIRIKRTSQDDLVFTGKLLASVNDHRRVQDSLFGLQIALYQTRVKAYILTITVRDYRPSKPETLYGAVSFTNIKAIHDFLLSKEGRGISDQVLLLLEQIARTDKPAMEDEFKIIPGQAGKMQTCMGQT